MVDCHYYLYILVIVTHNGVKDMTEFTATLVRNPLKAKSDNWQETAHKWSIVLNGQEFDYYTGLGHRKLKVPAWRDAKETYNRLKNANVNDIGLKQLLDVSIPVPPSIDDVLYSLIADSYAAETTFAQWCDEFGYDTDSRKALSIYEQCQQNADKLRKAKINIEAERERLQDY